MPNNVNQQLVRARHATTPNATISVCCIHCAKQRNKMLDVRFVHDGRQDVPYEYADAAIFCRGSCRRNKIASETNAGNSCAWNHLASGNARQYKGDASSFLLWATTSPLLTQRSNGLAHPRHPHRQASRQCYRNGVGGVGCSALLVCSVDTPPRRWHRITPGYQQSLTLQQTLIGIEPENPGGCLANIAHRDYDNPVTHIQLEMLVPLVQARVIKANQFSRSRDD